MSNAVSLAIMYRRNLALVFCLFSICWSANCLAGPVPSVSVILSFDGTSYGTTTTNSTALPPDCNGEPGPDH
jgi:hypothetical protein